jgi:hypothetical protein
MMEDGVSGVTTFALPAWHGVSSYPAQLVPSSFWLQRGHDFFEARIAAQ